MTLTVVSSSSTAMCAIVENSRQRHPFNCNEDILRRRPIFLPVNYTFEQLVKDDARFDSNPLVPPVCFSLTDYRLITCARIIRPCSVLSPPTDSLLCASTCYNDFYERCPLTPCRNKSSVIDDIFDEKIICAGQKLEDDYRSSSTKLTYALVALVSLQVFTLLAEVI